MYDGVWNDRVWNDNEAEYRGHGRHTVAMDVIGVHTSESGGEIPPPDLLCLTDAKQPQLQ